MPHQACAQHGSRYWNVQLILLSYSGAVLCIFFALEGEGHHNGCTTNKPKQKPRFRPQTNRITPMVRRKWIIWDLSIAIFSTKDETITSYWKQWLCTILSLKAPVTTSCWNMKSSFQETAPSPHLNCLTAQGEEHTCLWAVLTPAPCRPLRLLEAELHLLGEGGSCGDNTSRQRAHKQPRLARRSANRPTSTWEGNPDGRFLGWLGAARQFPSAVSLARAMVARLALPPAGFNTTLVLQTDVKATGRSPTPVPKGTTAARRLPPEQSSGVFSCSSRQ